jgi:hypothetical protein
MERKYIKTFEQYIREEGDATAPEEVTGTEDTEETPDKDEIKKPDYSDVEPTAAKIMISLNKAGFEINQDDIIKWDGGDNEEDEGGLLVTIDDDDKYFTVDNGLLYYQLGTERVMLGKLNNTDDLVITIKDYFDVKDADEKGKEEKKDKESDSGDSALDDIADDDLEL